MIKIKMKQKFIPVAEPFIAKNQLKYVTDCIKTNWISSLGDYIKLFEEKFSKFVGTTYAVTTSNGTTALHLALAALGIKKGDEVIVPDLTFVATANTVRYTGAKPVFVDSDKKTWCIDINKIKEKITKKTKAIIPVHLYGHPCDMDPITELAEENNINVIEDAAEAHGAEYKGKKVGSFGDISCFSFYGNKIITTGEGGMCVTNNKELAEKMRFLKDHGMSKKKRYYHPIIGFNYRMTNIQAAIGLAQLEEINKIIKKKREIAKQYNSLLMDIDGITLPPEEKWAKNVYWMYSVLIEKQFGMDRDQLMDELKKDGIGTRPFFYPMHMLPPYKEANKYPVSTYLFKTGINLPSSATLKEEEIGYICKKIRKYRK